MRVAILGTRTGQGHVSVMNSLKDVLLKKNILPYMFPDFAEDMAPANKVLCNFYNYLLSASMDMANSYVEFLVYSRNDKTEEYYQSARPYLIKFLNDNRFDVIISVAPFINYAVTRAIKENMAGNIPYHIIVTDPFVPIMVGFECPSADRYFVATNFVREDLIAKGIRQERIELVGYPVNPGFSNPLGVEEADRTYKKYNLTPSRKIVVCNSGYAGNPSFLKYLKVFVDLEPVQQLIFITGKNRALYNAAEKMAANKNNIKVIGYTNDMPELLAVADLLISKAGANSVFEAIYKGTPLVIDGTTPLVYQEKGIESFIKKNEIGSICRGMDDFISFLKNRFSDDSYMNKMRKNMEILAVRDPASKIINMILDAHSLIV